MSRRARGTGSVCFKKNMGLWVCIAPRDYGNGKQITLGYAKTEDEAHAFLDYWLQTGVFMGIPCKNKENSDENTEELNEEIKDLKSQILDLTTQLKRANIIIEKQKQELGHKNKKE